VFKDLTGEAPRTCQHGDHAKDDFLDTLNRTPSLGSLLVVRGIIAGGVEDGNTNVSIRVD
jgi:hypothetical protein